MNTPHFDYSCLYQSLRNFQLLQYVQLLIKNRTNDEDPLFLNSSQAAGKAPCWSCACNPLDDNVFTPFANRNPILIPATLESWQHQDRLHFQYSSLQHKLLGSNLSFFINRDWQGYLYCKCWMITWCYRKASVDLASAMTLWNTVADTMDMLWLLTDK